MDTKKTVTEIAEGYQLTPRYVRSLIRNRFLPATRNKFGFYEVDPADMEKLVRECGNTPAQYEVPFVTITFVADSLCYSRAYVKQNWKLWFPGAFKEGPAPNSKIRIPVSDWENLKESQHV